MANIKIQSIEPSVDGSSTVRLDILAVDTAGAVIPGFHMDVLIDAAKLKAALVLTKPVDVIAEVKRLIGDQVPAEWYDAALESVVTANTTAVTAATAFEAKIEAFGKSLPFVLKV